MEIGRSLVSQKCSICHNLDRIFGAEKGQQEWSETVGRMTKTNGDSDFLSDQEAEDIIYFLTHIRQQEKNLEEPDQDITNGGQEPPDGIKALVALKCSAGCHALDRVLRVEKDEKNWLETVNSMVEITGDPDFLTPQEKKDIVHFLSTRKPSKSSTMGPLHPDISENLDPLLDNKCNVCHGLERILRVERNQEEWADIVNSMVESTGDPHYLSSREKDKIINIISTWGLQEKKKRNRKKKNKGNDPRSPCRSGSRTAPTGFVSGKQFNLREQIGNDPVSSDPGTDGGTKPCQKKDQEDPKQFIAPPSAQSNNVLRHPFEFFDNRGAGHNLDKGTDITSSDDRRQAGDWGCNKGGDNRGRVGKGEHCSDG